MVESIKHSLVDSVELLIEFLRSVNDIHCTQPYLFVDLEGVNLSRNGTISLITIFVKPLNHVYLIDVTALQESAFSISPTESRNDDETATSAADSAVSLRTILESPEITKVFYDVRNDSDALYNNFGILLQGIEDVQLMECAARPPGRPGYRLFLLGLGDCIAKFAGLSKEAEERSTKLKKAGRPLLDPQQGGSFEVFNQRPLNQAVLEYCINDVQHLPVLRESLWSGLSGGKRGWRGRVQNETEKRVKQSQSVDYDPDSKRKRFSPGHGP